MVPRCITQRGVESFPLTNPVPVSSIRVEKVVERPRGTTYLFKVKYFQTRTARVLKPKNNHQLVDLWTVVGNTKIKEYAIALKYVRALLQVEPSNRQALVNI